MAKLIRRGLWFATLLTLVAGAAGYYVVRSQDPLRQADALTRAGDLRQAQFVLRSAIQKKPDGADLHLGLARLMAKMADPIAAEQEFRRAVALGIDPSVVRHEVGESLLLQGKAAEVLRLVPAEGPTPELAAQNMLVRAIAQLSSNNVQAAEATLRAAEARAPEAAETKLIAARIAAYQRNGREVEANVQAVLQRDPNQVEALLMQEQILSAKGDHEGALRLVDRAIAAAPWSAMARTDRAYLLMLRGQDAKAQEDVDAILATQPRFIEANYLHGVLLARRGRFSDAAVQLSKLDGAVPRYPQVLYYQALVAQALNQAETAAEFARRYNQIAPRDPDGVRLRAASALDVGAAGSAFELLRAAVADNLTDPVTLLLLARAYVAVGDGGQAPKLIAQVAAQSPTDPRVLTSLGAAELASGNPEQAFLHLEKALAAQPGSPIVLQPLVTAAIQTQRFDRAADALAQLRKTTGETEAVGTLTGLLLHEQGRRADAQATWSQTIKNFPRAIEARMFMTRLLADQGDTPAAVATIGQVLSIQPANVQALVAWLGLEPLDSVRLVRALETAHRVSPAALLPTVLLANSWVARGQPDKALAVLRDSPPVPGSVLLLAATGRAQAAAGQETEAIESFNRVLAANPGEDSVLEPLAVLVQKRQGVDAVAALFRDNLAVRPGVLRPMTRLVQYVANNKGVAEGLAVAAELRADPARMPYAAVLKGDLLVQQKRLPEAADAYGAEFAAAPSRPLLMRMVAAQAGSGREKEAIGALNAWSKASAPTVDVLRALAQLELRTGQSEAAAGHLRELLAQRPGDAQALNNLAWAYLGLQDDRARDVARQAYLASPSPDTADTLGWVLLQSGAGQDALTFLSRANAQRPADGTIAYHYAVALERSGDPGKAASILDGPIGAPAPFDEKDEARLLLARLRAKH